MLRNTCEFVTGRLLEISVAAGYRSVADVDEMIQMMKTNVAKLPAGEKYVIAADWRGVQIMSPETAVRVREMVVLSNPRVIRSSILTLPENAVTNLQAIRIIREAQNPNRHHFTSTKAMHAWLAEVLTPEESARLAVFLG